MAMEKLWNVKDWQKVMEFCVQSWSFTNFHTKFDLICAPFADISIGLESRKFLTFFVKCRKCRLLAERR